MLHLGDIKIAQNNNLAVPALPQQGAKNSYDVSTDASFFTILKNQVQSTEQNSLAYSDKPESLKNNSPVTAEEKARREPMTQNGQKEDQTQAIGRTAEDTQKAEAQVQGKDGKKTDTKNTLEKKPALEQQPKNAIEQETDAGTRVKQKQKTKKSSESDMHEIQEGLHRMIDFLKGKEQPEIRNIKLAAQELHDLLRNSKMNSDRGFLKKNLDKLASLIDSFAGKMQGAKSEHLAGAVAGIKELVTRIKAGQDKNQTRKHADAVEAAAPAVKELLAKMESLFEGVKGDGSHQRSNANDHGNSTAFTFSNIKSDLSAKHADTAAASLKNSIFRENLESIIQNAKVVVKDSRNGSFSVRLHPKELGSVNISLSLHEGVVRGKFLVETQDAKDMLTSNLDYIRQQLNEAGISVGEFQVNVNDQRGKFLQDRDEDRTAVITPTEQAVEIKSEYTSNAKVFHNGQIDVVI